MVGFSKALGAAIFAACAICSKMVCVDAVQVRSDAGPIDYEKMTNQQLRDAFSERLPEEFHSAGWDQLIWLRSSEDGRPQVIRGDEEIRNRAVRRLQELDKQELDEQALVQESDEQERGLRSGQGTRTVEDRFEQLKK